LLGNETESETAFLRRFEPDSRMDTSSGGALNLLRNSADGNLVSALVADRAYSPLTGRISYRVVDFASEMFDPDASKLIAHDRLYMIHPLRNEGEAL
jgi:hypothetical protein